MKSSPARTAFRMGGLSMVLLLSVASHAEGVFTASLTPPECVHFKRQTVLEARVPEGPSWDLVRLYFKDAAGEDFYFLPMRRDPSLGLFWTVLPQFQKKVKQLDLYVMATGEWEGMLVVASPLLTVSLDRKCKPPELVGTKKRVAEQIVVGETVAGQRHQVTETFHPSGVTYWIDSEGVLRRGPRRLMAASLFERNLAKGKQLDRLP